MEALEIESQTDQTPLASRRLDPTQGELAEAQHPFGDRDHQRGAGLPPVLLAWGPGGGWRVVSGLFGFQSQALPYLILCVVRVVANPARALVTNTCSIHVWAKIIA